MNQMEHIEDMFLKMTESNRNIYEPAELYDQNRRTPCEYYKNLIFPGHPDEELKLEGEEIRSDFGYIATYDNIVDFTKGETSSNSNWDQLNTQFLNYHKSLTIHEIINSLPYINYISSVSGLGAAKNLKVVDIGGGTGHTYCSFFRFPESIEYYLVDPNLRLIHDFFYRIFVKMASLKMAHVLAYAEQLPFKSNFADLVLSLAAIDHYKDYKLFITEAYRVLNSDGQILIFSHLDTSAGVPKRKSRKSGGIVSLLEKSARYIYFRKHRVGKDDHTIHLRNTQEIIESLKMTGFTNIEETIFNNHFLIKAKK